MFEDINATDLISESDVEQKIIYPLMTAAMPNGLGHNKNDIFTKINIRHYSIGKGSDQKSYFPDYIATKGGIPLIIVEAKRPGEDLVEAYREARLYAAELNAEYPSGVSPVYGVIVSDGLKLCAGFSDSKIFMHELQITDISIYNERYVAFCKDFDAEAIEKFYNKILEKIRPKRFWKPRKLVGGVSAQREEVAMNSFGATISADFSSIFNPLTLSDRSYVAKNAYIPSKRRERYVEPIDRVVRASIPLAEARSKTIEDTSKPSEIFKVFRSSRELNRQVLLIVGSAGAGKTTFVDHLKEVALPSDIRSKTVWIHLNMNTAPVAPNEIYSWLRKEIITKCKESLPDLNFDELDVIKSVHSSVVQQFTKGVGKLYAGDKGKFNSKLAEQLERAISDEHLSAQNHANFISVSRGKLLVIVLDNADKRYRDEQLLMFEAAQWIQREFLALVVLPLREETYDNYQHEAPLDTALKDLVFRIEPPMFQKILQKRVNLAIAAAKLSPNDYFEYRLPNGMRVKYKVSDQAYYLSSIMKSVFEHDMHVRRLIVGLSGRNMRRAMEIFLDFCTSGHIGEDHITKMIDSGGQYVLPLSLVTTVLLRSNLRFYDSSRSYLVNLLSKSELDSNPSFFTRILALRLLDEKSDEMGPKRLKGYVHAGYLKKELSKFGIEGDVFDREIEILAKSHCILTEDFRTESISEDDLVCLAPAGRVHLQVYNDVFYFAAISEDTWFQSKDRAEAVAEKIRDAKTHYSPRTILSNAKVALCEISESRQRNQASYGSTFNDNRFSELTDLGRVQHSIVRYEKEMVSGPWVGSEERFTSGSVHKGKITNRKGFGIFVELEAGVTGLVHASSIPSYGKSSHLHVGQEVSVIIQNVDAFGKRMALTLAP